MEKGCHTMDVIIGIIIGFILWRIYHKCFRVIYFGRPIFQMLVELGTAFVIGYYLAHIIILFVMKAAESLVGIILYAFMIGVTIYVICVICYLIKAKHCMSNTPTESESNENEKVDSIKDEKITEDDEAVENKTGLIERSVMWVKKNKLLAGLIMFFYVMFVICFILG